MSGITLHDFYWIENEDETINLFFRENSMPCSLIAQHENGKYNSILWVYKVGGDILVDEDLDVLKLRTQVRVAEMINEMKDIVYNNPKLTVDENKGDSKATLLFSFYNEVIPQMANNYFFRKRH